MKANVSRRQFIHRSALVSAALGPFLSRTGRAAPSERIRLAFIACGGRARQLMGMFRHFPDVEVPVICDVIEPRMAQAAALLDKPPYPQRTDQVLDYRSILDRKDIDAVVLATTQHWHGLPFIQAAQAGKHIFVEKPLSHTVSEGRAMVVAAQKCGILAMMGTQQRAGPHYQKAVELIRSGRLGKIGLVECWNYHNTGQRTGRHPDSDPPPGYHWDRWLGPAPKVPFNRSRLDNSWWFDYGGGMLTNWAVHHIDIILWAMSSGSPKAVSCTGGKQVVDDLADTPDTIEASWEFDGWQMQYSYRGFDNFHTIQSRPHHHGICFHGHKASLVLDRFGYELREDDKPGQIAEQATAQPYFSEAEPQKSEQDGPWQRLFVDCVKGNQRLPLSLAESHRATVCCHLANIAYLSGRKFQWDGTTETIPGEPPASNLLSRPRRKGYELPPI